MSWLAEGWLAAEKLFGEDEPVVGCYTETVGHSFVSDKDFVSVFKKITARNHRR